MSGTSKAATKGYYRRKVTLACESCRKRRVKCSGSHPCVLCIDNGSKCTYDSSNRSRRGPRPRQPPSAPTHEPRLAPRPSPGQSVPIETTSSFPLDPELSLEDVDEGGDTGPVASNTAVELPLDEILSLDHSDAEDTDSDASEDGSIGTSRDWEANIGNLISAADSTQTSNIVDQERRVKVICHLIEAFHAKGIKQLRELLKPKSFLSQLSRKVLSDGLIFGICAYSCRLSVHNSLRRHDATRTAHQFAQAARERLITPGPDWKHINDIRTICILVEYETACGNGRRAWADIAMGGSLLELEYSAPLLLPEQKEILDAACNYLRQASITHRLGRPQLQHYSFQYHQSTATSYGHMIPSENTQQRIYLLDIYLQVENLCSQSLGQAEPPFWARHSRFRLLQSELERQFVQANISSNGTQSFEVADPQTHQSSAEFLQLSLIWHLCAITLNKMFLPIPDTSQHEATTRRGTIHFHQYPDAPALFLSENISRCDASADAICLLARQIVNQGCFFHNPLVLGYACMNSALVLSNRLHRESDMRRRTTMEHLLVAFAVMRAVGLCYQPAEHWLHVAQESHMIGHRMAYMSGPARALFKTFFSRFEALEEVSMIPLDAIIGEHGSSEHRLQNGDSDDLRNVQDGAQSRSDLQYTESANLTPTWQQLYTSHLSKVVDHNSLSVERSLPMAAKHVIADVREVTPCAAARLVDDDLRNGDAGIQTIMDIENGTDMADVHEAGAILASLSAFDLTAMPTAESEGWEGGDFDELMTFLQMPSLLDMDGMDLDMSQFI